MLIKTTNRNHNRPRWCHVSLCSRVRRSFSLPCPRCSCALKMGQFISQVQQPLGAARESVSGLMAKKRKRSSSPSESEELNEILDASMRSPKKCVWGNTVGPTTTNPLAFQEETDHCPVHLPSAVQGGEELRHYRVRPWKAMAPAQGVPLSESLLRQHVRRVVAGDAQGSHRYWRCRSQDHQRLWVNLQRRRSRYQRVTDWLYLLLAALFTVFGSLYLDEVTLNPRDIISTLATATLFQLDGLIERCAEVMNESINAEVSYYPSDYSVLISEVKRGGWVGFNGLQTRSSGNNYTITLFGTLQVTEKKSVMTDKT